MNLNVVLIESVLHLKNEVLVFFSLIKQSTGTKAPHNYLAMCLKSHLAEFYKWNIFGLLTTGDG